LEIDIVLDELRLAKDELDATREAMEAAQKVMDGEEIMFELGQKNNQDLLTVQDYYGSSQKDYYRALSRFNLNLVSLSRVKGILLSEYGLKEVFAQTRDNQTAGY
jgi:outer membrane protein TolC